MIAGLTKPLDLSRAPASRATETGVATAGSFAALSLAAANIALEGPGLVTALLSAVALAGAGLSAVRIARTPTASARIAAITSPAAVTTLTGALVASNAAFKAMMEERGQTAHPDALATSAPAALALFTLRRQAIVEGEADGFVPPSLFCRITSRDGMVTHVFEEAVGPPVPNDSRIEECVVGLMPTAAVIADERGRVRAANPKFRTLAGDGANLGDGLSIDEPTASRLVAQAHQHRSSRVDVALKRTPERRVRLSAKPFPGAEGVVLVAVSDVTDQSALEAQIAQSQKMQAIGQLAGGIAHDFNNVLTAIIVCSDLLLQNHRPSDPAFRDIMNIKQSAQRAAGLVKQLLAFSRRQTLRPTVLNLNDVVADLSIMLDRLLGERIRLELAYGRDLWPVLADLSQIEQVVINLAVNARDAMKGGGRLTITTRNVPAGEVDFELGEEGRLGDAVLIEIEDVGTGMPQEILDKIFEPFFTTKATGEGTGLGLSTVYGIVKQTGGTLSVSSVEGEGTVFRVFLPRTESEARTAPCEPEVEKAPANDLTGSATILLAEDEEVIRTFAARALTAKGYRVLTAASGAEALEVFGEHGRAIDLVLSDVIMPELDGPGLVRKVRAERPDLKVLFMSGYSDGAALDEMPDAQFLPKPFSLKALAEAVKKELARS